MRRVLRVGLGVQGAFYVLTGVWPLVSLRTFEAVTGPKVDDWLVAGRISPICLADAAAEFAFLVLAGLAWRDRPR